MAKKRETDSKSGLLDSLKKSGWFRTLSDRVQIGLPDIIGTFKGVTFGLEVKSVKDIAEDGLAPRSSEHCFTPPQVKELFNIGQNGGWGLGILICGPKLFWFSPDYINEKGQVDCKRLVSESKFIDKVNGSWDHVFMVLELLWRHRVLEYQKVTFTKVEETHDKSNERIHRTTSRRPPRA